MKPPYQINQNILTLVSQIHELLGKINATHLYKTPLYLRRENRIRTIQSSLQIEGNTLTVNQVTAILNGERIIAPKKDIKEVENAIKVYESISDLDFLSTRHLLNAHKTLMSGLITDPGRFRTRGVAIVKGEKVEHLAPDSSMVNGLMNDLYNYLKNDKDIPLIKSCVFHYEFEFIHPFSDGNGRMGRLWQSLILMQSYPVFEFLPLESIIKAKQKQYYQALSASDKSGSSTPFIEYMLEVILLALTELLQQPNKTITVEDRISIYGIKTGEDSFSRKDYLLHFKEIKEATASRDLRWATENGILKKTGDKRLTRYRYIH